MAFEELARHVETLGGMKGMGPFSDAELDELSALIGAPIYPALRWWWSTYGACDFGEPVVYRHDDHEDLIGVFIDPAEVRQTIDDFEGKLGLHRLPINDDSSGNHLIVDPSGAVYYHIHDALLDRNQQLVAPTFEQL